jgi:hypothetical protein
VLKEIAVACMCASTRQCAALLREKPAESALQRTQQRASYAARMARGALAIGTVFIADSSKVFERWLRDGSAMNTKQKMPKIPI